MKSILFQTILFVLLATLAFSASASTIWPNCPILYLQGDANLINVKEAYDAKGDGITEDSYVTISKDGHLQLEGQRVRYWTLISNWIFVRPGAGTQTRRCARSPQTEAWADLSRHRGLCSENG